MVLECELRFSLVKSAAKNRSEIWKQVENVKTKPSRHLIAKCIITGGNKISLSCYAKEIWMHTIVSTMNCNYTGFCFKHAK